jgi:predicted CXXCH cytochrome family protein
MISGLPELAIVFWLALLLLGPVRATEGNTKKKDIAQNPHGDSGLCSSCHTSAAGGRETLRFEGDVSKLCRSCHDGRLARREAHVTGLKPSEAMAQRIPPQLPLEQGILTCLSCHDVAPICRGGQGATVSDHHFLRGNQASDPLMFCFQCHAPESYRPFNPHDQLAQGKSKADTCTWCHRGVPDVNTPPDPGGPQALRAKGADLCRNCHTVAADHPVRAHMGATPPAQMMWYMSAYELKSKMRLPLSRLLDYARTAKRAPRSIPLDEEGRITCYSCHNSHEKDLLPNWDPRSIGAEPKQSANHRVRSREGPLCVACHQK